MAVYAVSDLHGNYQLLQQILNDLKDNDTVYFLGDACDRGPDSLKVMQTILADNRFIYLCGNHEELLIDYLEDLLYVPHLCSEDRDIYYCLGGKPTVDAVLQLSEQEQDALLTQLTNLPLMEVYENAQHIKMVLSHAGFTPTMDTTQDPDLLWDRSHWAEPWNYNAFSDVIIVHGHTPAKYIAAVVDPLAEQIGIQPGAFWYCGGFKCCIDCETYVTDACVLLDLDTFDEKVYSC